MLKKIALLFALVLTACHGEDKELLKVGTIAGPETQLMEIAKKVAAQKYKLKIKIVEFSDYMQPNAALNDGSIDANMFQHQPFLDEQIQDHQYALVSIGKTFVYPMGIYSTKIKNLKQLSDNAKVAIPNDPSNEARALLLLQQAGLIKLKNNITVNATTNDIVSNPKKLQFKELDCAQIPRSLPDVDVGLINTNYAIPAGLSPKKDAIFHENEDSPYANIIVTRKDKQNDPRMKNLVASLQSPEVVQAAKEIFSNEAIPSWEKRQ